MAEGSIRRDGNIEYVQALDLSYFQACLKEAMRLRPAVGLNITRHVPKDGAELDGVFLTGDTRVAVNGWVLHRDKEIFGKDADVFRPERWLEDEEIAKKMDRFMFQVSGVYSSSSSMTDGDESLNTMLICVVWRRRARLYWTQSGVTRDK